MLTSGQIKIVTIVGARPNFMKVAPIIKAICEHNEKNRGAQIKHLLIHTGQHYDPMMSDQFFSDLGLPKPDVHMGIGSGSHAVQTAQVLEKFETVLLRERPQFVIVVGDVNSTLACALATAKISFDATGTRPLVAHIESGLRSFDRTMPEEVNRIVTDHVSDLLFVTEESGLRNLRNEGVSTEQIHFVGNTMIDSVIAFKEKADASTVLEDLGLRTQTRGGASESIKRYALLTLHRPSNVDNRQAFLNILAGIEELSAECPIVFPVHPRTRQRIKEFGIESYVAADITDCKNSQRVASVRNGIILTGPAGYLDFLCLMKNAAVVVTDSGGIQEETTCLGIPCVTTRDSTERPVTVDQGTNIIAGTSKEGIRSAIRGQFTRKSSATTPMHWDGRAAVRIVDILVRVYRDQAASKEVLVQSS